MIYIIIGLGYFLVGTALSVSFYWGGMLPHERRTWWGVGISAVLALCWLPAIIWFYIDVWRGRA